MWLGPAGIAGLVALMMLAGVALAAKPKTGWTYSTPGPKSPSVFFRAKSHTKLILFNAGLAIKCKVAVCGGFGGVDSLTAKSVKVSKSGNSR